MADSRHVGGIRWAEGSSGPFQQLVRLGRDEARALRNGGRMDRICKSVGLGVHLQLLDQSVQEPRLLITSAKEEAVEGARLAVVQFLDRGNALAIPLHPIDMQMLWFRRRTLLDKLEQDSACRIVLEYRSKKERIDFKWKQDCVHLLGTQAAQALAVQLLAPYCTKSILPSGQVSMIQSERNAPMQTFDQVIRGINISLSANATVAARAGCKGLASPVNCIVTGLGYMPQFAQRSFFAMRVRQVDLDRELRGGTRIGISSVPLASPIPQTLQTRAGNMWVIGRGQANAPASVGPVDLPAAYFDNLKVGEELGVLVTQGGALEIYQRSSQEDTWDLLVQWDACIDNANRVYAVLELSGRLVEMELTQCQPPEDPEVLDQDEDVVETVKEDVLGAVTVVSDGQAELVAGMAEKSDELVEDIQSATETVGGGDGVTIEPKTGS